MKNLEPPDPPSEPTPDDRQRAELLLSAYGKICEQMSRIVVGQDAEIEQLIIAILARGHCLLEGVPGLAKTLMVRTLSQALHLSFRRIQFTPDLMPADITGTDIIQEDPTTGHRRLVFEQGPIFAQMVLADEINRTPAKTQAALLEAMQEHSVTIGGKTYPLEEPFFVLATQNPIEQEGTYPLPEAQRDRFLFLVIVDYPELEQEKLIVTRTTSAIEPKIERVLDGRQIIELQQTVRKVPVPEHVLDFAVRMVRLGRPREEGAPDWIRELVAWGPGPRACQQIVLAAKVRALLQGRYHVTIEDIEALARPVLRHRIVPTFRAEAEGIPVDEVVTRMLKEAPRERAGVMV
ncbi:MAG: AAA family ATPase [Verrucomicrobiota bacterium]|nr:AAA family ATPase [Verrucomicrobiota bacterium]